ncbi:MAG: ABC transporter permease subunit [Proteobacteria bacterium]|nr:ABC transporter permease subunit [Pseudomonadota bacterium]
MLRYVTHRLLHFIPTALGVVTLTFLLIHLVPGDPVEVILGEQALPADRAALSQQLGLDLPLWEQYARFMMHLAQGDVGTSLFSQRPVADMLWGRLPATAELAAAALCVALLIAFPLGIWAAVNRNRWPDHMAMGVSLVGFSMPNFWMGPMLIILFALWLGWLPVSGREGWSSLVLPAVTLGTGMAAITTRLLRSALLEVLHADFIRTAKAKGVPQKGIILKHALRNALLPVITVVFLQAGALLTGAILTEAVFSWPGLGSLMIDGLNRRDYPVVQGCVMFIALTYMVMTLLSDLLYAWADPRIRFGGGGR